MDRRPMGCGVKAEESRAALRATERENDKTENRLKGITAFGSLPGP